MQTQKDDETQSETDTLVANIDFASKNKAKLRHSAMRGMHYGHAVPPIASHLQHDYLPVIEGKWMPSNRAVCERIPAMAAYESSRAAPFGAIAIFRFVQFFTEKSAAFAAWNDARVTRKALAKLSDRELDDIGLCRGDIETLGR